MPEDRVTYRDIMELGERIEEKLDKIRDEQDVHNNLDSTRFTRVYVILAVLMAISASPKVGGPSVGDLVGAVVHLL